MRWKGGGRRKTSRRGRRTTNGSRTREAERERKRAEEAAAAAAAAAASAETNGAPQHAEQAPSPEGEAPFEDATEEGLQPSERDGSSPIPPPLPAKDGTVETAHAASRLPLPEDEGVKESGSGLGMSFFRDSLSEAG